MNTPRISTKDRLVARGIELGSGVAAKLPSLARAFAPQGEAPRRWYAATNTHAGDVAWHTFDGNFHSGITPAHYYKGVVLQASARIMIDMLRNRWNAFPAAAYALGSTVVMTELHLPAQVPLESEQADVLSEVDVSQDPSLSVIFGIGKGELWAQLGIGDPVNRTFQQVPNVEVPRAPDFTAALIHQFPDAQRI